LALVREGKWNPALEFIQEGIERNADHPELFLLHQTLTMVYSRGRGQKDCPWVDRATELALGAAWKAYELGLVQRPEGGRDGEKGPSLTWTDDLEEDFCYAAHMIPLLLREKGSIAEALEAARKIAAVAPNYVPLQRTLGRLENERQAATENPDE
jgi:hypothetical protein